MWRSRFVPSSSNVNFAMIITAIGRLFLEENLFNLSILFQSRNCSGDAAGFTSGAGGIGDGVIAGLSSRGDHVVGGAGGLPELDWENDAELDALMDVVDMEIQGL